MAMRSHSRTIFLNGRLEDEEVAILINLGCTGNLVYTRVVRKLTPWRKSRENPESISGFDGNVMS